MKRALVVLALACAVAAQPASGSSRSGPTPAAATVALGGLLHRIYGAIHGYWTCPAAQVANGRADCLAEVRSGERWHELSLSAYVRRGALVFTTLTNRAAQTWIRRWSPYSRYFLVRYHEPAPGVASVNSPSSFDDWGWIAGQARGLKPGATRRVGANDGGPVNGFERLLVFTCSRHGGLTTCRNALGDAMRYRPAG